MSTSTHPPGEHDSARPDGTGRQADVLRVLVFATTKARGAELAAMVRAERPSDTVSVADGEIADLRIGAARYGPDVLVTDAGDAGARVVHEIEQVGRLMPEIAHILVSAENSPEFLKHAMRAGVREVLGTDVAPSSLGAAITRLAMKAMHPQSPMGRVLAFLSCKGGGGGATFLATNVAYALAAAEGKRVILIDFNLQWGDAAWFVSNKRPTTTLADVASQIHRIDASFLMASLTRAHANLGILAAPEDPVHALEVQPEHVDVLLRLARMHFDYIVLDTGRALDAVTVRALDHADVIFPVLQLSLPFIRDGKRLLQAFRALDYPADKVRLILNRYEKGGELRLVDLEEAIGTKVYRTFPNDYDVASAAINQGVPVVETARGSAIARSVRLFAHELIEEPQPKKPGWLSSMLHRHEPKGA